LKRRTLDEKIASTGTPYGTDVAVEQATAPVRRSTETTDEPDDWLLDRIRAATKADSGEWLVAPAQDRHQPWIHAEPVGSTVPRQGWKIHVSSFGASAADTLARVLPFLVAGGFAFKVLGSLGWLRGLNGGAAGLSQIGKFITVYPETDARAVEIARALAGATRGLRAPQIPSDRPVDAEGVVYYRYGAFGGELMQTPLGEVLPALIDPGGRFAPDRRGASPQQPAWVEDPFAAAGLGGPSYRAAVVAQRYRPVATLAESPDVIVQLTLDLVSPRTCIIKRAKLRHVHGIRDIRDSVEQLRREAALLAQLNGRGITPLLYDVVDDGNELAVITEDVGGETLDRHLQALAARGHHMPHARIVELSAALADALAVVHECGHIHGDIKSTNIVIDAEGRLRLVDFGLALEIGSHGRPAGAGTRGYISRGCRAGEPPAPQDDLFALGAILYLLMGGAEPSRAPDANDLTSRPVQLMNPGASQVLIAVMERCLANPPHEPFPSAREVSRAIRATLDQRARRNFVPAASSLAHRTTSDELLTRVRRAADFICAKAEDVDGGIGWRSTYFVGKGLLTRDLNAGMAGTIFALAELVDELGVERHADVLHRAAWTLDRLPRFLGDTLEGLYVGEMGVAVALLRAGQTLGDAGLVRTAVDRARTTALRPMENPDLFHGMAGQLLGHLVVWDETRNQKDLRNAVGLGERLLQLREGMAGEAYWRIPAGYGRLSGASYLGYAHGAAGIADMLLELFEATQDHRYLDIARDAIAWIARQAVPTLDDQSGLAWPLVEGGGPHAPFWCHGAAGIARLLLQADRLQLGLNCANLLGRASRAVAWGACWSGPTLCHGLAGNADLLIDVWKRTGDEEHLEGAYRLLSLVDAYSTESEEGHAWISEAPRQITPDYLVGCGGIALTLLRFARPDREHALSRAGFRRRAAGLRQTSWCVPLHPA
jgi:serine/threonine protein kinase